MLMEKITIFSIVYKIQPNPINRQLHERFIAFANVPKRCRYQEIPVLCCISGLLWAKP